MHFVRLICLLLGLIALPSFAADPGVGEKTILVGQSISLKEGKDAYGVAAAAGARLYFDQLNQAGGVHGRRIVLKVLDDNGQAGVAEANARRLVETGAFILFGSLEGGPSTAVARVAEELKIPFFGPMAGSPNLRRPHNAYVFPVRAEHREEFKALIQWGKRTGMTTLGLMHADTEVGLAHLENVRLIAGELGMKVVLTLPFKGEVSDAQIGEMANAIADKRPDMLINHGSGGIYQRLIARGKALGVPTLFMGVNSGSTQIVEALGERAHGLVFAQVVPNPLERKHPISREFQDTVLRAKSDVSLSYGALEGFMTAKALVLALRATGRDLDRAALMRTLEQGKPLDLGGMTARYAPGRHDGANFVDLAMVARNGKFLH